MQTFENASTFCALPNLSPSGLEMAQSLLCSSQCWRRGHAVLSKEMWSWCQSTRQHCQMSTDDPAQPAITAVCVKWTLMSRPGSFKMMPWTLNQGIPESKREAVHDKSSTWSLCQQKQASWPTSGFYANAATNASKIPWPNSALKTCSKVKNSDGITALCWDETGQQHLKWSREKSKPWPTNYANLRKCFNILCTAKFIAKWPRNGSKSPVLQSVLETRPCCLVSRQLSWWCKLYKCQVCQETLSSWKPLDSRSRLKPASPPHLELRQC